jgi:biotin operon repressor
MTTTRTRATGTSRARGRTGNSGTTGKTSPTTTGQPATGRTSPPRTASPATRRRTPNPQTTHTKPAKTTRATTPADPPPTATQPDVPAKTTSSDDRVRAALLTAGGKQTVEQLAETTGLGRSTVAKVLARLETAGLAVRATGTGGGRTRQPDQWNPAAQAGRARQPATTTTTASPGPSTSTLAATDNPATSGTSASGAARPVGPKPAAGSRPRPGERNLASGTFKLGNGELTRLVAEHFAAHPNTGLTPGEVARSLGGRSPGAVRNAADKLTRDGSLRQLDGRPRRYTTA